MKTQTPIYLRDLNEDRQKSYMEGFEKLKERAERQDREVLVGYYLDKPILE